MKTKTIRVQISTAPPPDAETMREIYGEAPASGDRLRLRG